MHLFVSVHLFVCSIIKIQLKKTTQSLEMTKRESEQNGKQAASFNHDWLTKWKKRQVPLILIDDIKSLLMWWVSPNYKMEKKFDNLFSQIKSLWNFFSRTLFFSFLTDRPEINCMMFWLILTMSTSCGHYYNIVFLQYLLCFKWGLNWFYNQTLAA